MSETTAEDCETQLRRLRLRLEFIEKTGHLGYWELDISRKTMFWSPEMYTIFGLPHTCRIRRNFIREQLCIEDIRLYKDSLRRLLTEGRPVETVLRIRRTDGELIYSQFRASLRQEDGRTVIAGTLQNVTPLVRIQQQLAAARAEAERLSREKSYFYAQVSHDLRQPLQALKIFIALLKEEELTSEQNILLRKIEDSADNLGHWLDNLLETARLESGGVSRQDSCFRLDVFLQRLGEEYKEVAAGKGGDLISSGGRVCVTTDAVLLERIMRNLLNNAVKYGGGQIRLHWYRCGGMARIYIRDYGEGLSPEARQNLFKAFSQNGRHRHQGTGLGLAIVKELADMLHIKIAVKSKPGRGTLFVLSLPSS